MLPNLLKKTVIDFNVLKALLCLAKQKNAIFLHSLEENVEDIVANVGSIRVANEQYKNEGLVLLVNLLFWISKRDTLEKLLQPARVKAMKIDDGMKAYFRSTLKTRLACL